MFGPFDLVLPPIVLLTSIVTLPFTLLTLPFTYSTSESSFSHRWFKHFWWWFGPASKPIFASRVRPLLAEAKGVVLDIGPGSGVWMSDFGQIARESPNRIQKIYGVEPNLQFHKQLLDNAKKNGLECVYEPIAARADQLEGRGIKKGSVDTIITVHVLCSVGPHASELVKDLYECLKPGGQWLVFEHVASRHAPVKMWQGEYYFLYLLS